MFKTIEELEEELYTAKIMLLEKERIRSIRIREIKTELGIPQLDTRIDDLSYELSIAKKNRKRGTPDISPEITKKNEEIKKELHTAQEEAIRLKPILEERIRLLNIELQMNDLKRHISKLQSDADMAAAPKHKSNKKCISCKKSPTIYANCQERLKIPGMKYSYEYRCLNCGKSWLDEDMIGC